MPKRKEGRHAARATDRGKTVSRMRKNETRANRRRQREHERSRSDILDAARALVLEQGMDSFSLREVARRADYSPAALYRYFDSKQAILEEIATMAIEALGSYLTAVPSEPAPRERLIELGMAYLRFARENPEEFALVFNKLVVPMTDWRLYAQHAWPFTIVVEAVRDGVAEGVFELPSGLEAEDAALGVWSLVHGAATLFQAHLAGIEDDLARYIEISLEGQIDAITRKTEGSTQ